MLGKVSGKRYHSRNCAAAQSCRSRKEQVPPLAGVGVGVDAVGVGVDPLDVPPPSPQADSSTIRLKRTVGTRARIIPTSLSLRGNVPRAVCAVKRSNQTFSERRRLRRSCDRGERHGRGRENEGESDGGDERKGNARQRFKTNGHDDFPFVTWRSGPPVRQRTKDLQGACQVLKILIYNNYCGERRLRCNNKLAQIPNYWQKMPLLQSWLRPLSLAKYKNRSARPKTEQRGSPGSATAIPPENVTAPKGASVSRMR